MRLGFVIYDKLDQVSGGYIYDRLLVDYLLKLGDEVEVVALKSQPYFFNLSHNFSPALNHRLSAAKWDVLLQDGLCQPSLFLLNQRLRSKINYPIIALVHYLRGQDQGRGGQQAVYQMIESRFYNSLDGLVLNSEATMSTVKKYVKTAKPYLVAYPGRDRFQPDFSLEEISRRTFEPGPLKILFVGNVIKRKGLHVLLSALAEIPNEHWQLKVIGRLDLEPDYVARIKKLIRVKGWEKSVLILGPQNESDLIQSYRGHQLLAVPSLYEAFGMVYLEALSFGLPVIASAEGGAKEIFNGTDAGMLVAPNDFPAIAKYIKRIMADRKLLLKQSINAHVRHKKFPTWSESLKDVRDFLLAFSTKKAYKHDNG